MMVLYIYLGSIIISIGANALVISAVNREIENRGYKYKEKKKNISKNLIILIKFLGLMSIPLFNLFLTGSLFVKFDEFMEDSISSMIHEGEIIKTEDEKKENSDEKEESKVITYNVNNELTREEKINFLKQELHRLTGKEPVISIKSQKNKSKQKRR